MDCVDIDLAACLQQTVARLSFEPDTECNEHQPDIFTVRLIAVYLDSPCQKDKNNDYRLELHPLTSSPLCCADAVRLCALGCCPPLSVL